MKINEYLSSLPPELRERALGRLEGMSLAMRICRNRAEDAPEGSIAWLRANEATLCAEMIRMVQVQIGSGRQPEIGDLSADELEELWRIY